jgi:hypothetical protein
MAPALANAFKNASYSIDGFKTVQLTVVDQYHGIYAIDIPEIFDWLKINL